MTALPNEAGFFRFMVKNRPSGKKSQKNYRSWLRYVGELYSPNFEALTEDDIKKISVDLSATIDSRDQYKNEKAISNIKSALNKYLDYISSNTTTRDASADIISILGEISTTKKIEIDARLGQGKFRKELVSIWRKCAVTKIDRVDLLVASHIKPWKESTNEERLDPYNGLLLAPNLDKLFDRGYISFNENGSIIISALLDELEYESLGISPTMQLYKIEENCLRYLEYHKNNVLVRRI